MSPRLHFTTLRLALSRALAFCLPANAGTIAAPARKVLPGGALTIGRVRIRRAGAADEAAIRAIVHSERLNPMDLRWPRFVVACDGERIVGAVQMRHHRDGSHELGSLVVTPELRGQGLATRLIDALLAAYPGGVHMITQRRHAAHFARWGFTPAAVLLNWLLGQSMTLLSLLQRRPPRRLAILTRRGRA